MINDDNGSDSRRTSVKSLLNSPPSVLPSSDDRPDSKASSTSDLAQQLTNEMASGDDELEEDTVASSATTETAANHKPRRYSRPPIWATKWQGLGRQSERDHRPAPRQDRPRGGGSDHQRGPGGSRGPPPGSSTTTTTTITGCPPSISGIKPFESVTRTVTSWLHAHLSTMSPDQLQTVELEAKIGTIQHKKAGSDRARLDLPIVTEAVVNQQYVGAQCSFSSQLPETLLEEAKRILDSADPKFIKSTEHTIHRDEIYEGGQDKGNLRITRDDVTGRQVAKIRKKAIAHIMIHCPTDPFDIRLSLATESPTDDVPQGVCRTRRKDRISYLYDGFRADLTKVSGSSMSSELEMECDSHKLIGYFTDRNDPRNMDKVEELLQILLDSMRYVNRRLKA